MRKDDLYIFDVGDRAIMKVNTRPSSAINRIEYTREDTPVEIYIKAAHEKGKTNHQIPKLLAKTLDSDCRPKNSYRMRLKA